MYQTIGIICAMDKEFALIRDALSHGQTEKVGLLTFYVAEQNGKKIVAAVSGIGKVNAACCAQMMISRFGAECILNSGVCGALSPTLHRMDIVLADELCYHDLEEEHLRDQLPGFSRFHPDTELNGLVRTLCKEQGLSCVTGRVASGDAFVLDPAVKAEIASRTGGDAIEMEGAAIGHTCALNQLPFAVIRCVSDGLSDSEMDYNTFAGIAAQKCTKLVLEAISRL